MVNIVKRTGEPQTFSPKVIERSVIRAGGSSSEARRVAQSVARQVKDGMRSEDVLDLALSCMLDNSVLVAKYDLKRALMKLGPAGFAFEEFVGQVLTYYGYKVVVGSQVPGKVISQEVDVVARRTNEKVMIEAKYHNDLHVRSDTKVAMYTYARFLDVSSVKKNGFTSAWLVTNTKVTDTAARYSSGVGLRIVAWRYPSKGNLEELLEAKGLYPVTIFRSVEDSVKKALLDAKIVLAKELASMDEGELRKRTKLKKDVVARVLNEARALCSTQ